MKIAITGVIGSGKTTVSNYLRSLGYDVFDCDLYNKELLKKDNKGYKLIVQNFIDITNENGEINKNKLADIIFNHKDELNKLNSLIHPLIKEGMLESAKDKDVFIAEVPLLFETDFYKLFDYKLLVICDEKTSITRLIKRGLRKEDAINRINNQMPYDKKIELSDYVINNNKDEISLFKEIDKWIEVMKVAK